MLSHTSWGGEVAEAASMQCALEQLYTNESQEGDHQEGEDEQVEQWSKGLGQCVQDEPHT